MGQQTELKEILLKLVAEIEEIRIIQGQIVQALKLSLQQQDLIHAKAQRSVVSAYAKVRKQIEELP